MAKTPNVLLERPEQSRPVQLRIDPLSQVFLAMRVKNSECVRLELAGTWGFRFEGYDHAHFGVIGDTHLQVEWEKFHPEAGRV